MRLCTVDDCDRKHQAKGYCKIHYLRMAQYGTLERTRDLQPRHTNCTVEGCDTTVRSPGTPYCEKHYCRIRRNGNTNDPITPTRSIGPRPISRNSCSIEGCDHQDSGPHGLCAKHNTRQRRHGDPLIVLPTGPPPGPTHPSYVGDDVGYTGAHARVRVQRGRVQQHDCVDCDRQAKQWSYDHNDPNEKRQDGIPYSPDPDHYSPRCVPCHKRFDLSRHRSA